MSDKALNPTKEYYGEVMSLLEWLNRNFHEGALGLPMVTFRTAIRSFGCYVPKKWDHKTGTSAPEFRLNPIEFRDATLETKCMELLKLLEHLRQGKTARTNYHDRDYASGIRERGLQTHRLGNPDKETGEQVTLSVIAGGKFEKLVSRKVESGFDFSWAIHEEEKLLKDPQNKGEAEENETRSGKRVKYTCPQCDLNAWAKHEAKVGCFEHEPPVRMNPA